AVIGVVLSLVLAPRHAAGIDEEFFWDADPARRAARGEEEGSLGVTLAGYEDLYDATGDLDALRGRVRTGILIGAVALGQPGLDELVMSQVDAYLAQRAELDPDGTFLQEVLEKWVHERLHFDWRTRPGFYARSSTAMFLAARGDPAGRDMLLKLMGEGGFYTEFFPYIRARHPGWGAVEPVLRTYLEKGTLASRVEAGTTLLDYYTLFGVGEDLWKEHGETIRAAFLAMRKQVLAFSQDFATVGSGGTALVGIAMLGMLGYEEERKIITRDRPAAYGGHIDLMKIARVWIGLDGFEKYEQTTREYRDLEPRAKEQYYAAAAHRLAAMHRGLIEGTEEEREQLTRLLEAAFDETYNVTRALAMQTLVTIGAEEAPPLLRRAIVGRGGLALDAATLRDDLEDPVAIYLPALRTQEPDYSALAAVSLLKRLDGRALQR
ncbi:MAG: hypothetical protein ACYTGK_10880, partial [Planctomycetota bacterium]